MVVFGSQVLRLAGVFEENIVVFEHQVAHFVEDGLELALEPLEDLVFIDMLFDRYVLQELFFQ